MSEQQISKPPKSKEFKTYVEARDYLLDQLVENRSNSSEMRSLIHLNIDLIIEIERIGKPFSYVEKIAVYAPSDEIVTLLETDPYVKDFKKLGALFSAAYFGNREFFETYSGDINAQTPHGKYTALHFACANNQVDLVRYLVTERKANVNAIALDKMLPVFFAIRHNHMELIQALREVGADFEIEVTTDHGHIVTPLILAAARYDTDKNAALVHLVLEYTPSLIKTLGNGNTIAQELARINGAPWPERLVRQIQDALPKLETKIAASSSSREASASTSKTDLLSTTSAKARKKKKSKAGKNAEQKESSQNSLSTSASEPTKPGSSPAQILSNLLISSSASTNTEPQAKTSSSLANSSKISEAELPPITSVKTSEKEKSKAGKNVEKKESSENSLSTSASQQTKPDSPPTQISNNLQASSSASTNAVPQVDSPMNEILTPFTIRNRGSSDSHQVSSHSGSFRFTVSSSSFKFIVRTNDPTHTAPDSSPSLSTSVRHR